MENIYYYWRRNICIRAKRFSGKDLGKILDPGDVITCFTSPDYISSTRLDILLSDNLWKTNDTVKQELISRIENYCVNPSICIDINHKRLRDDLGI